MLLTILTLLVATGFFVWGRVRSDLVALVALVVLMAGGVVTTGEALAGFASPIVIMMIGLFVVGGAIFNTGLAKKIGASLLRLAGGSGLRLFLVVMGATSFIGAFVSNTGTVALMLPIVVSMAAGSGVQVSRLLMPLAFASSMGGMLTLIGTPPNLVVAEAWEEAGHEPLTFFTFFPAGVICLAAGTLLLLPLSKWLLTERKPGRTPGGKRTRDLDALLHEYGLAASIFRVVVPEGAALCGRRLSDINPRALFSVDILEVRPAFTARQLLRQVRQKAARPATTFRAGDTLYLRGDRADVARFVARFGLDFPASPAPGGAAERKLDFYELGIAEIVLMPNSSLIGTTLAAGKFRERFGVNVLAIKHRGDYITAGVASATIRGGDVLLVQGTWADIAALSAHTADWVVVGQPLEQAARVTLDYKAPVAALVMLAMVVALVVDVVPPVLSVMVAALAMVLAGCFRSVEDAYKTINWESVVLIAAMMPMSAAMEKTGLSALLADSLVGSLGTLGPLPVLAGIYFTTSLLTLFISNTATAVLLAPIAMTSATALGVSPLPFLFAVTFAASLCFASPFSTPPNALVMVAGRYRFADYLRVGLPLQLLLGVLMIFVLPLLFPF